MKILYDIRASGKYGIARFSQQIYKCLNGYVPFNDNSSPFSSLDSIKLSFKLDKDADFFVSTSSTGPVFGRIPYSICLHDLIQLDRPDDFSLLVWVYFKYFVKRIATNAAIIFTVSEFSKDRIAFHYDVPRDKIIVLGNGISDVFYEAHQDKHSKLPFIFNYSGGKIHKNVPAAIRAFNKISHLIPHSLIIASERSEIEISDCHLSNRIQFVGKVTDVDLKNYLSDADALLFPSIYEGFGLPIIEAFACGTQVITSNTSSMPEVSRGYAILVDPFDVDSISGAILLAIDKKALGQVDSNKLIDISKKYTWKLFANKLDFHVRNFVNAKKQY